MFSSLGKSIEQTFTLSKERKKKEKANEGTTVSQNGEDRQVLAFYFNSNFTINQFEDKPNLSIDQSISVLFTLQCSKLQERKAEMNE